MARPILTTRFFVLPLFFVAVLGAGPVDVPLVDAARKGDTTGVRTLLEQHVDVNVAETDGTTALHWAVRHDDLPTVSLLIRAGAVVQMANRYGVTPLSLACVNGSAAIIEILLESGADANTTQPGGETALMAAARTGKLDAVQILLRHGASPNAKETWRGQTALMWAAAEGHASVVQTLIEHGADIHARSDGSFTPLLFAVREGRIDSVRALLEAGASVNETLQTTSTANPADGASALLLAVGSAHYELAALLLDRGADPNLAATGWTALHQITWARRSGLGDNAPVPRGSGNMDSLEIVRRLVAHGANVNARITKAPRAPTTGNCGLELSSCIMTSLTMIGATPFLMAARTADADLMRLLAELGADPLLPNEEKTTPLMVAAGVGTRNAQDDPGTEGEVLEAVKVAWELGGDVNAVDDNGQTALHGAALKQAPSLVPFLVEKGINAGTWIQKDSNGWTPLRIAEGIHRLNSFQSSPATANELRKAMVAAGVSTEVEPEKVISGATK